MIHSDINIYNYLKLVFKLFSIKIFVALILYELNIPIYSEIR